MCHCWSWPGTGKQFICRSGRALLFVRGQGHLFSSPCEKPAEPQLQREDSPGKLWTPLFTPPPQVVKGSSQVVLLPVSPFQPQHSLQVRLSPDFGQTAFACSPPWATGARGRVLSPNQGCARCLFVPCPGVCIVLLDRVMQPPETGW